MSRHVMSCPGPGFQSSILSVYHLEPYSYWHFKIIFDLWKWCIAAPDFSISAFRPWKVETFHGEPETKERKIITQLVNLFEPRLMVLDKRGTPKLPIRKRISFAMGSWTMDMFYLSLAGWELFVMDIPDTPCRSKYGWVLYSSSAVDTSNISLSRWRLFLQIDMIWYLDMLIWRRGSIASCLIVDPWPFWIKLECPKITWICCEMSVSINESGKLGNFPNLFSTEPLPSTLDQDAIDVDCNGSMTWEDPRLAVKQGFRTSCTSCAFRGFASFVISFGTNHKQRTQNHRNWKPTCTEKVANPGYLLTFSKESMRAWKCWLYYDVLFW